MLSYVVVDVEVEGIVRVMEALPLNALTVHVVAPLLGIPIASPDSSNVPASKKNSSG